MEDFGDGIKRPLSDITDNKEWPRVQPTEGAKL